jgi:hypothetical protein
LVLSNLLWNISCKRVLFSNLNLLVTVNPSRFAQAVMLLICIREMTGSNLNWDNILIDVCGGFPQPLQVNFGVIS